MDFEEFVTLLGPKLSTSGIPEKFHGTDFDTVFWKVGGSGQRGGLRALSGWVGGLERVRVGSEAGGSAEVRARVRSGVGVSDRAGVRVRAGVGDKVGNGIGVRVGVGVWVSVRVGLGQAQALGQDRCRALVGLG